MTDQDILALNAELERLWARCDHSSRWLHRDGQRQNRARTWQ